MCGLGVAVVRFSEMVELMLFLDYTVVTSVYFWFQIFFGVNFPRTLCWVKPSYYYYIYLSRYADSVMGSFGRGVWLQCYWCDYWVEDPYIIDWIGRPLCNWCFDWHVAGGGPYEPTSLQRSSNRLRYFWRNLPETVYESIAWFLRYWHEP